MLRLEPGYSVASFFAILLAMILGSRGERSRFSVYGYWRAVGSSMKVIVLAVAISLSGDILVYRALDRGLAVKAKEHNLQIQQENLSRMKFISAKMRDEMMEKAEAVDPMEQYTVIGYVFNVILLTLLNGFWALIVAIFTRQRMQFSNTLDT